MGLRVKSVVGGSGEFAVCSEVLRSHTRLTDLHVPAAVSLGSNADMTRF